jgi:hypothetical protein
MCTQPQQALTLRARVTYSTKDPPPDVAALSS